MNSDPYLDLLGDFSLDDSNPSESKKNTVIENPQEALRSFTRSILENLQVHNYSIKIIKNKLNKSNFLDNKGKELLQSNLHKLHQPLEEIGNAFKDYILLLSPENLQLEIKREGREIFHGEELNYSYKFFIELKLIYENIRSFMKIAIPDWAIFETRLKELDANSETSILAENIREDEIRQLIRLNRTTELFLENLRNRFYIEIIGETANAPKRVLSNLKYNNAVDYSFDGSIQKEAPSKKVEQIKTAQPEKNVGKTPVIGHGKTNTGIFNKEDYLVTSVIGTKDWNSNDAYILDINKIELNEEEENFLSASYIDLRPGEAVSVNAASAMVRKNTGLTMYPKYSQMVTALLEFNASNVFEKDYPSLSDDSQVNLYHIGPLVFFNIIVDDMKRRGFGTISYLDKNQVITIIPEKIIKSVIIKYWNNKFKYLKSSNADSYIHFAKWVQNVRADYHRLYDLGAGTRKGILHDVTSIEDYLRENEGKFFGYRKKQIFRRFVPGTIWGDLPEANSTIKVHRFFNIH